MPTKCYTSNHATRSSLDLYDGLSLQQKILSCQPTTPKTLYQSNNSHHLIMSNISIRTSKTCVKTYIELSRNETKGSSISCRDSKIISPNKTYLNLNNETPMPMTFSPGNPSTNRRLNYKGRFHSIFVMFIFFPTS